VTCWRRLDEVAAGGRIGSDYALLLDRLRAAGQIEWARAVVDSTMCRRKRGAATGASPVDRGRLGSKHRLIVDEGGLPLAFTVTGGNRHDSTQLLPLVDGVPSVAGKVGRPRRRPNRVYADRAYDYLTYAANSAGAASNP
jgi:Transposase DDE domain